MRREVHLTFVFEVIKNSIKVFVEGVPVRALGVRTVLVAIGGRDDRTVVSYRETVQIEWNTALSGIDRVDGGRVVDNAHATVGRCRVILVVFKRVHGRSTETSGGRGAGMDD